MSTTTCLWIDIIDTSASYCDVLGRLWTLKDKILHWDPSYVVCDLPKEEDTLLNDKLRTYSDTCVHVHHGQTLKEYIERHDSRAQYEKERWNERYIKWCATAGLKSNRAILE